ncbi:hypothetical protein GOD54_23550 [Sinorhizobium medicae]|nr:hypothetical protein [Sinorhizobium medicae]
MKRLTGKNAVLVLDGRLITVSDIGDLAFLGRDVETSQVKERDQEAMELSKVSATLQLDADDNETLRRFFLMADEKPRRARQGKGQRKANRQERWR